MRHKQSIPLAAWTTLPRGASGVRGLSGHPAGTLPPLLWGKGRRTAHSPAADPR